MDNCIDTNGAPRKRWTEGRPFFWELGWLDIFRQIGRAISARWDVPGFGGLAQIVDLRKRVTASGGGGDGGGDGLAAAARKEVVSLDPSPGEFGELLRDAAGVATRYWSNFGNRRAFTRPPEAVVERIQSEPLPLGPTPVAEVLEAIEEDVVPYPNGAGHRRWWGFVSSPAHPAGIAAELISTTLNNYVHGTSQIAVDVELKVLEWLAELIGMPAGSSGLLVSGGSAANLVALGAARQRKIPDVRKRGVSALERPLAVYASNQIHSCIGRALEILGLGTDALRLIAVDDEFRIDIDELQRTIRTDLERGIEPLAIIGSAGTVNTGAVDDLEALADIAREVDAWFHVDGAYGGFAGALPELAERYRGIERADSVAADAHKWLYVPVEAAAVIVRDLATLEAAFSTQADYLRLEESSYLRGRAWLADRGIQLSRSFRALKVWAVIKAIGLEGYRELWRNDIAVAREVTRLAREHPRLEVLAESDLSIFAIRYLPQKGAADDFNKKLLDRIHKDGRSLVTSAVLKGKYGLRGCVVNFRSTLEDARVFVDSVIELGTRLESEDAEWKLATYR